MLARRHRLTRGDDYRRVVRTGTRCGGPRIVVSSVRSGEHRAARFGFIVSKQVGSAVVRNTVRRRLKDASHRMLDAVPPGTDVVIRALPAAASATFAELEADLARCLARFQRQAEGSRA